MKTRQCRMVAALKTLAQGLSLCALLHAGSSGTAWAGKPASAEGAPKDQNAVPSSTPHESTAHSVSLVAYDKKGKQTSRADGFFVSSSGIVATVRHLLTNASRVAGETSGGRHFTVSGVLAADPIHDLVLLQTDAQKTSEFPRGDLQRIREGDEVTIGERGLQKQQHGGVIAKADDLVEGYHWILIKATVSGGVGGSPIFSDAGN